MSKRLSVLRDEGPGQSEHAGITDKGAGDQLGQLLVVSRGQIRADLADLLLDKMVVVDQPFGRGRDGPPLVDRLNRALVGLEQDHAIVVQSARQRLPLVASRIDLLHHGEAAGVFLEPLDAEQFLPDRFAVVPQAGGVRARLKKR